MKDYHVYEYSGPVYLFDKYICNWTSKTSAPNINKAKSNLAYRFKQYNKMASNSKIILPNKLTLIE